VPFILTSHFEYIITKGDKDPKNFQAYVALLVFVFILFKKIDFIGGVMVSMLASSVIESHLWCNG